MPHDPMNVLTTHPKLKLSLHLSSTSFPAGSSSEPISGKLVMESLASTPSTSSSSVSPNGEEKTLGIGIIMVELFAIQELISRDHSATSTFLHLRRVFQGPGLPPSNAVLATMPHLHPSTGHEMPEHYYPALRGLSTFLFSIPIPSTSPSSISFPGSSSPSPSFGKGGNNQARVRYELRASVGVWWKRERRLVVSRVSVDVVGSFPFHMPMYREIYDPLAPPGRGILDATQTGTIEGGIRDAEAVVVGESGKVWLQGRIIGGFLVSGQSGCLELQVKNHSARKNTSLTLSLTRKLVLASTSTHKPSSPATQPPPIHLTENILTVPFRGSDYQIPPGAEGVANLVFDVPRGARGSGGWGLLEGEELEGNVVNGKKVRRQTESLFEVTCTVEVRLGMGIGSKDIILEVPIEVVHSKALPPPQELERYYLPPPQQAFPGPPQQMYAPYQQQYPQITGHPNAYQLPPSAYGATTQPQPTGLPAMAGVQSHLTGLPTGMGYPGHAYPQAHPQPPHPQQPLSPQQTQAYYDHPPMQPQIPMPYVDPATGQVWVPPPPPASVSPRPNGYSPLSPPQPPYAQGYTGSMSGTPPRAISPFGIGLAPPPPIGSAASIPARPRSAGGRSLPVPPVSPKPGAHSSVSPALTGLAVMSGVCVPPAPVVSPHEAQQPQPHSHPLPPVPQAPIRSQPQPQHAVSAAPIEPDVALTTTTATTALTATNTALVAPNALNATSVTTTTTTTTTKTSTTPLHSPRPRPQMLTPKHSFSGDKPGSLEAVDQLEKMADVLVKRRSGDLSDLSLGGLGLGVSRTIGDGNTKQEERQTRQERGGLDVLEGALMRKRSFGPVGDKTTDKSKTLPPLQTQMTVNLGLLNPPTGSSLGITNVDMPETSPVPCDQTPPTPTLHALRLEVGRDKDREMGKDEERVYKNMGKRKSRESTRAKDQETEDRAKQSEKKAEGKEDEKDMHELLSELAPESGSGGLGGLDALERRLLREVGTRRPSAGFGGVEGSGKKDVRGVLGLGDSREMNAARKGKEGELHTPSSPWGWDDENEEHRRRRRRRKSGESDVSWRSRGGGRSGAVTPSPKPSRGGRISEDDEGQEVIVPRHTPSATRNGPGEEGTPAIPIAIPMKSPEPLNDSAISSLTLAGGLGALGGEDELNVRDVDVGLERERDRDREREDRDRGSGSDGDGRTHRGRSRSRSQSNGSSGSLGMEKERKRHIRERPSFGGLRGKDMEVDKSATGSRGSKESRSSKKTQSKTTSKTKTKTAASKGRVTAWLGGIDVGVPPVEQIIPPSPSVVKTFRDEGNGDDIDDETDGKEERREEGEARKEETTAPNPRSSGFVPIATLNRSTIILPARHATGGGEPSGLPPISTAATATTPGTTPTPKFFYPLWSASPVGGVANTRPMSIRTDRRVSPPSVQPLPSVPSKREKEPPMSYSAAAKVGRNVDHPYTILAVKPGPSVVTSTNAAIPIAPTHTPRLPIFPSNPPVPADDSTQPKYDIRSARGGRGGKVTAVASLWASGAITGQPSSSDADAKVTGGRPVIKPKPAGLAGGMGGHGGVTELGRVKEESLSEEQVAYGARAGIFTATSGTPAVSKGPLSLRNTTAPTTASANPPLPVKKSFSAALKTPLSHTQSSPTLGSTSRASTPSSVVDLSKSHTAAKSSGLVDPTTHKSSPRPQTSLGLGASSSSSGVTKVKSKPPAPTAPKPLLRTSVSSGGLTRGDSRGLFGVNTSRSTTNGSANANDARTGSESPFERSASGKTTPSVPSPALGPPSAVPPVPPIPKLKPTFAGLALKSKPTTSTPVSASTSASANVYAKPATAILSSSHAVPHLSSTASLARPKKTTRVNGGVGVKPDSAVLTNVTPLSTTMTPVKGQSPVVSPTTPTATSVMSKSISTAGLNLASTTTRLNGTGLGGGGFGRATSPVPKAVGLSVSKSTSGVSGINDVSGGGGVGNPGAHMAFGQARLRDLIRKYQG